MEAIKKDPLEIYLEGLEKKVDEILKRVEIPKEVFRADEAAEYLCISYYALQQLARIGEIRYAMNGNIRLFKKEWLDEWMEKGGTR